MTNKKMTLVGEARRRLKAKNVSKARVVCCLMLVFAFLVPVNTTSAEPLPAGDNLSPQSVEAPLLLPPTTIYVDTTEDDVKLSDCTLEPGDCSLRGAIDKANASTANNIIFVPKGTYLLYGSAGEDDNQSGDLDVREAGGNLTIIGERTDKTIIDGGMGDRVFHTPDLESNMNLTLERLTIQHGQADYLEYGGCIRSYSNLYLKLVNVTGCSAAHGGGIYAFSHYGRDLVIEDSEISETTATLDGAGLYLWGVRGSISRSLFFHNDSYKRGGAIFNLSQLTISASTITQNNATEGAAIFNYSFLGDRSSVEINSSTIAYNANGISNYANALEGPKTTAYTTLRNTIMAYNGARDNCLKTEKNEGRTLFKNAGNNIDSGISCEFGIAMYSRSRTDPKLLPLENYGGPTATLALAEDSPAINRGNPATCSPRDQRYLAPADVCDIGAFEYGVKPVLAVYGGKPNTESVGSYLGRPVYVALTNRLGNPLDGWEVDFAINEPDPGVVLSEDIIVTDDRGRGNIAAAVKDGVTGDASLTVSSGGVSSRFSLSSPAIVGLGTPGSAVPYGSARLLPATGFSPWQVTYLPPQLPPQRFADMEELTLDIPRLNIDARVVGVPEVNDQWDLSWLGEEVGYLDGTAFPTRRGNTVLTAHRTLANGLDGPFFHLGELHYQDEITLTAWGMKHVYQVRKVYEVPDDDLRPLQESQEAELTLITCQGFDPQKQSYGNRLIVNAVLVRVEGK